MRIDKVEEAEGCINGQHMGPATVLVSKRRIVGPLSDRHVIKAHNGEELMAMGHGNRVIGLRYPCQVLQTPPNQQRHHAVII